MDLRAAILKEHGKTNTIYIANWVGRDTARFEQLMQLFLHDEYRIVQRSAWIVSVIAEDRPELVHPYLDQMATYLAQPALPVAVKRNITRIFQHIELPESLHGPVMNVCFELLADPKETVAVRCFSMGVLADLCRFYPEIKPELRLLIDDMLAGEPTAGMRSKARHVLKAIGS
jgi:hypothetical protein